MYKINIFDKISFGLVLIGALNWGTIGLLNINFVRLLVGGSVLFQRIVYILVAISAIELVCLYFKCMGFKLKGR